MSNSTTVGSGEDNRPCSKLKPSLSTNAFKPALANSHVILLAAAAAFIVMSPYSVVFADEADTLISNQGGAPVNTKDLPHASGKTFETLDQYLAHLKEKGAMDIPYYDLQPDGRYRLITGRGGNRVPPVFFTREELSAKFGFSQ